MQHVKCLWLVTLKIPPLNITFFFIFLNLNIHVQHAASGYPVLPEILNMKSSWLMSLEPGIKHIESCAYLGLLNRELLL